tara:strand:+ start:1244 stop:1537 length:294 start_codon:yes stop_codon:yes gene_type:complete
MPIKVKSGETEQDFVSRCIPIEIGYGKSIDVASGICYSIYQNRNMKKTTASIVHSKIAGIPLNPTKEELKAPCTQGYEQYGMKIKNGRKVPNCIPQK